ncbi:hypothetical protein GQ55_9G247200 [Panicum hallii var. hallii]|uniref:Uncharacterized protein n=1 Tax=Panicum hallii var. hallii TaxID=1504633 RepID=A0A2T7C6R2_9POAL|nr:hypothetical protein GQ55_9G247200 [Panicum hallii var. hallii]
MLAAQRFTYVYVQITPCLTIQNITRVLPHFYPVRRCPAPPAAAPSRHFPVAAWCRTPGFTAAFAPGRNLALALPPLAARRTAGRARTRSRCFWGGVTAGSKDQATHILHLMLELDSIEQLLDPMVNSTRLFA